MVTASIVLALCAVASKCMLQVRIKCDRYVSKLPEKVDVEISIFRVGVMFDDGTVDRVLNKDDLNDEGMYPYRLFEPTGLKGSCHHITAP